MISEIMGLYNEDILIQCRTDGVVFSEEPKDMKYLNELGGFAFEGYHENISIDKSGKLTIN